MTCALARRARTATEHIALPHAFHQPMHCSHSGTLKLMRPSSAAALANAALSAIREADSLTPPTALPPTHITQTLSQTRILKRQPEGWSVGLGAAPTVHTRRKQLR